MCSCLWLTELVNFDPISSGFVESTVFQSNHSDLPCDCKIPATKNNAVQYNAKCVFIQQFFEQEVDDVKVSHTLLKRGKRILVFGWTASLMKCFLISFPSFSLFIPSLHSSVSNFRVYTCFSPSFRYFLHIPETIFCWLAREVIDFRADGTNCSFWAGFLHWPQREGACER